MYACDARWWDHHEPIEFAGEKWTQLPLNEPALHTQQMAVIEKYGLRSIQGGHGSGLGEPHIHYGSNSGYQAINLAYLWGAAEIILLGYDMQATGGKQHWFGDHPDGPMKVQSHYDSWMTDYSRLADGLARAGVEVINCSRATALTCFRQAVLEEVLAC